MLKSEQLLAVLLSAMLMLSSASGQSPSAQSLSSTDQGSSVKVTIYRDVVRFTAGEGARRIRVELIDLEGNKVFDSGWVEGNTFDWLARDEQGQPVDSSLFAYTLSVKARDGGVSVGGRGNVIIDRERPEPGEAAPAGTGEIHPLNDGVFDINAGKSYNINANHMGVGTATPLTRLHIGAGAAAPVTQGATLLVEDGAAAAMVLKSTQGGEMFLFQNNLAGVLGTATQHPLTLRTNNLDRVVVDAAGNVGIGTQTPGQKLSVAGTIESTTGGFVFPDGTAQKSAGMSSITHDATLSGNGSGGTPLAIAKAGVGTSQLAEGSVTLEKISPTGAVAGQSLMFDGKNLVFGTPPPSGSFALPFLQSASNGATLFDLTNTGTGGTALFTINNPASATPALMASTNGTGPAITARGAINTSSQYNIAGDRVLGVNGDSVFVGTGAGAANTDSESNNAFFGTRAAFKNNGGRFNAFFGNFSGLNNTTGSSNSFFGLDAGENNTTGGSNTFVGRESGTANTTGSNNTFIGSSANAHSSGLTFATAIGSGAVVSTSDTIQLGRADGSDTVRIPGDLNVTGAVTIPNLDIATVNVASINTSGQYSIGGNRVLSVGGTGNLFAGVGAGAANATGVNNSFFGASAGFHNTLGLDNAFFGAGAGLVNTEGVGNAFFGKEAGTANTLGANNAFFGREAGASNTQGGKNAFFGAGAGSVNTTGSNNTIIGSLADTASGDLSFGTALGAGAVVSTSNTIQLGRSNGSDTVNVSGALNVGSNAGHSGLFNGSVAIAGNLSAHNLPGVEFDVPTDVFNRGQPFFVDAGQTATIKTITVDVPADGFLVFFGSVLALSQTGTNPQNLGLGRLDLFDETSNTTIATAEFAGPESSQTIHGVLPVSAGSRTLSLKVKAGSGDGERVVYFSNTGSFVAMFFPARY